MAVDDEGWRIEPLSDQHDRGSFDCDRPVLSEWLRKHAGQFEARGLARTYVLVRPGEARVQGYYALSTCHLSHAELPAEQARGLPRKLRIPAVLIGKLAVDRGVMGQGLGSLLLVDALRRIGGLAEGVGIRVVVVDAIDDRARGFYRHHDFRAFPDQPDRLFLAVATITRLGLAPFPG